MTFCLELLELNGSTVILDAMSCQKKIAEKITGQGGDYMISLKGNQGNLHREVQAYFHKIHRDEPARIRASQTETTNANHGRIEVRRYRQLALTDWVGEAREWNTEHGHGQALLHESGSPEHEKEQHAGQAQECRME